MCVGVFAVFVCATMVEFDRVFVFVFVFDHYMLAGHATV